jgi:hypothetical protein
MPESKTGSPIRELDDQGQAATHSFDVAAQARKQEIASAFDARARVVHSRPNGMGLLFTTVAQEQLQILERWLRPFRQKEWLALNNRRSQRVLLQVPVRVSGRNALGSPFEEEAQTVVINANGALLLLSTQINQGQTLTLSNMTAHQSAECVVAYLGQHEGERVEIGVGFLLPNPSFGCEFSPTGFDAAASLASVTCGSVPLFVSIVTVHRNGFFGGGSSFDWPSCAGSLGPVRSPAGQADVRPNGRTSE